MKYFFYTSNINQALYKKFMIKFLILTLDTPNFRLLNDWIIYVYPSTMASQDPFFHGVDGVGGVTGMGTIKLYVEDEKTSFLDIFLRVFRRNALMISHELSHAILIQLGYSQKVPLRNDDYSGHKAGTILNYSTAEVHDRHMEKRFKTLNFYKIMTLLPKRLSSQVLDFTDLNNHLP